MKAGFNGWWLDMAGNRTRRIYRQDEWKEIYRLYELGQRLGLQRAANVPPANQNPANSDV